MPCRATAASWSTMRRFVSTSCPVVGSSATTTLAPSSSACARTARCCWPPELVRIAPKQGLALGELCGGEGVQDTRPGGSPALGPGQAPHLVEGDVPQQCADPAYGVEDSSGVLRYVSDEAIGYAYVAGHPGARRVLAEQREARGRLAAAGRADERGDFPGPDLKADPVDDRPAVDLDA